LRNPFNDTAAVVLTDTDPAVAGAVFVTEVGEDGDHFTAQGYDEDASTKIR